MTARETALEALLHVDENEGYSNIVLDKTLRRSGLDSRDAALASALFYGVLERRLTLDYLIAQFSKTPVKKLSPPVREILRMGIYQIQYMDKIPDSACVNEAVALVKKSGSQKASGFVNAVLRAYLRGKIVWPDKEKAPLRWLSVRYSCPEWLILLWEKSYGRETALSLLSSLEGNPPLHIRVNTIKTNTEYLRKELEKLSITAERADYVENALCLGGSGEIARLDAFVQGLFHVQDLSSQICCALVDPRPGERVVDVCAAPGGKSFTMAERMENRGELFAFDLYKGKVRLIREGAERLGLSVILADLRDALKETGPAGADRVLCDAPCSGLGIIRRKPEIRYKSPASLDSLPDLQYRILCNSSRLVRPGGLLFYSTCTLNPAENAGVAERFLRDNRNFRPAPLLLPAGLVRALEEPEHQITLMPQLYGTDGFFIASFQKTGESL